MEITHKQSLIIPLMARMMVPFRRAVGYSFDTDAFLNDDTYAKIIVQEAMESAEPSLQDLGKQLAHLLGQDEAAPRAATSFGQTTRSPVATQSPFAKTGATSSSANPTEAEALRAELIRKYQGGIR
jgi:hypothetical protein